MNKIILIGRLTRDPELRYTQSNTAVANLTLAVDRTFPDQQGNKQADFIDVVAWRQLAELCAKYLGKGRLVAVSGSLQIRSFEHNGQKRRAAEVVADEIKFLDRGEQRSELEGFGKELKVDDDLPF